MSLAAVGADDPVALTAPAAVGAYRAYLLGDDVDGQGQPVSQAASPLIYVGPVPTVTINGVGVNGTLPPVAPGAVLTVVVTSAPAEAGTIELFPFNTCCWPQNSQEWHPVVAANPPPYPFTAPQAPGRYDVILVSLNTDAEGDPLPLAVGPRVDVEEGTSTQPPLLTINGAGSAGMVTFGPETAFTVDVWHPRADSDRVAIYLDGECCAGPAVDERPLVPAGQDGAVAFTAPVPLGNYRAYLLGGEVDGQSVPVAQASSPQIQVVPCPVGMVCTPPADGSDERFYYDTDAIGSVRQITNDAGAVVARYDYTPFGEEVVNPPVQDPRRFAGKEWDAESDLNYFGARYFASEIGRFTSVDPVLEQDTALTNPLRWNRYGYGLNNPLRNVDADGRDTIDLAIGFGQGIWSVAKGIVTLPYALVTNPSGVVSAFGQDIGLLGYGLAHPGEVLDAYVGLATSANDADQRALGAAVGAGTAVAAAVLAPTAKGSVNVVHYTDASGASAIQNAGQLRAGTYVTKAGDVSGMTEGQIEGALEIQPGRGQYSFRVKVDPKNLKVPSNGPTTSGGAWQRQLIAPCKIEGPCTELPE